MSQEGSDKNRTAKPTGTPSDDGVTGTIKTDSIVDQWRRQRPDIDPTPMAVCGDIWRTGERIRLAVLANWANWGLDFAGSDVILTLRRQGRGQALSPSALSREMMLSTSAMTNRLDRLEKRGLLKRTLNPEDRRGLNIELTDEGFSLADEMLASHVQTEDRLLAGLSPQERDQLRLLLGKIAAPA